MKTKRIIVTDLADALTVIAYRESEIAKLRALVVKGSEVVEDFMPNIGHCALQDYRKLNEFLVEAGEIKRAGPTVSAP